MPTANAAAADRPLSPKQVADIFGVTADSVRAWAEQGKLPYFRTPGGQRRFRRADVEAVLAADTEAAAS